MKTCLLAMVLLYGSVSAESLPPALLSTWSRFQAAVKVDDVDTLASLTHFPLRSSVSGAVLVKNPEVFKKKYKKILDPFLKDQVGTVKPGRSIGSKGYVVDFTSTGLPYLLGFEKFGEVFLLSYIEDIH